MYKESTSRENGRNIPRTRVDNLERYKEKFFDIYDERK